MAENIEGRPDRPSKLKRLWPRIKARGFFGGILGGGIREDVEELFYEDDAVKHEQELQKARGDIRKVWELKKKRSMREAPGRGTMSRRDFLRLAVGVGLSGTTTGVIRYLWGRMSEAQNKGYLEIKGKRINLVERGRRVDANKAAWASLLEPKSAYIIAAEVARFGRPVEQQSNLNDPATWLVDERLQILSERMEGLENFLLALRTEESRGTSGEQGLMRFLKQKSQPLEKGGIGVDYTPGLIKLNQYAQELGIKEMTWNYLGAYFQTAVENGGLGWNNADWFLLEQVMGHWLTSGRQETIFMGRRFTVAELQDLPTVVDNYNARYAPTKPSLPRLK